MFYRAWYVDGRLLVVMVTFCIILPLCLLKNLGKETVALKKGWGIRHIWYSIPGVVCYILIHVPFLALE